MRPDDHTDPDLIGFAPADDGQPWQRNAIVALAVCSALVLIAGVITFMATRGSSDGDGDGLSASPASAVASTGVATSSTSTTSSVLPTTSTSTTTTTTPMLANADAGPDQFVERTAEVTLTALDLAEGTPDEAVRWKQTAGPSVTADSAPLRGASVDFTAPDGVVTLRFELIVAGTDGVASDETTVRVFGDLDTAVFVDGATGSDGDRGTPDAPLRTLAAAAATAGDGDIYLRSVGVYDTSAETLDLGRSSLFGGFDAEWNRTLADRAMIEGASVGLRIVGADEVWVSAIDITTVDAADDRSAAAVSVSNVDVLHIDDCRIVSGDGGRAVDSAFGGSSLGIALDSVGDARIVRSTVNAGAAADGRSGRSSSDTGADGESGDDGRGRSPGVGGSGRGAGSSVSGGDGGRGGRESNGTAAPRGGAGGTATQPDGQPGSAGAGGAGGAGGDGGVGIATNPFGGPVGAPGEPGDDGEPGAGGRGGGGGFGVDAVEPDEDDDEAGEPAVDGGGGAGGGAGGAASDGAAGAGGGSSSIGLWAVDVERLSIVESLVAAGAGGNGGAGASASVAGDGGAGGSGAAPETADAGAGAGGGGGGAGAGGSGGHGGGGAGGWSIGLHTVGVDTLVIESSTARAGRGGAGAAGGLGGQAGDAGTAADGRNGGRGGLPAVGQRGAQGSGATGGSSIGWLDRSNAEQRFDDAIFAPGPAGVGGGGTVAGDDGRSLDLST